MNKDAKIMFIYPPISKHEKYSSDIGNSGGRQIPLGIYYLASYMRSKGYEVYAIDAEAEELSVCDIIRKVEDFNPDFIGISSTTVAFHRALEVAQEVKKKFSIPIILGGAHITSNHAHAMSFPVFDYGVFGEGEITLYELCEALLKDYFLDDVLGIIYRCENSTLKKNKSRPLIEDLDIVPFPAYDLIPDMGKYTPNPSAYKMLPVRSLITSRGCPGQCTFCDKNLFGSKYRKRSAQNVFDEIMFLRKNYGVKEIDFVDDTFLIDKQRAFKLFELLKSAEVFIYWSCKGRINDMDEEMIAFAKKNGCWKIQFGIESGDENILKVIKKNTSNKKVKDVISLCKKYKIETGGYFIVGHPTESLESIDETIKFALTLPLDNIIVTINTPIPGTPQYKEASKYGVLDETDWSQFNLWRPVFIPRGLSHEILLSKHKEFYRRFYLRPRILLKFAMSFFGSGGFGRFLAILKSSKFLLCKS